MMVPYIGGNQALDFSLQQGLPPAVVLDGARTTFGFGLIVNNVGEADVGAGTENPFVRINLEGFKPSDFGTTADQLEYEFEPEGVTLLGAHKNFDGTIIPGGLTSVVFEPLIYQQTLAGGSRLKTIRASACYDYANYATVQLCFKDNLIENAEDSTICTLTGEKGPQNSGGPLQITSVVQNPLDKYKIHVTFILEHVGTGDVYGREPDEFCDPSPTNTNRYKPRIRLWSNDRDSTDDDLIIDCPLLGGDNDGVLTMGLAGATTGATNTELVTCTIEVPDSEKEDAPRVFEDTLNFEIDYRYGQFIDQPITIQSMGR